MKKYQLMTNYHLNETLDYGTQLFGLGFSGILLAITIIGVMNGGSVVIELDNFSEIWWDLAVFSIAFVWCLWRCIVKFGKVRVK